MIGSTSTRLRVGGPGCRPTSYVCDAHAAPPPPGSAVRSGRRRVGDHDVPEPVDLRRVPGGMTVVESYWLTIAGPSSTFPAFERGAVVEARRHGPRLAAVLNQASPSWRSASRGDSRPARARAPASVGIRPMPRTRTFGISTSDSSKRREYSRSWMSSKSARSFSTQASSIAPGGEVDPQLVALAEVAAVGDALDQDAVVGDAVLGELRPRPAPRAPRTPPRAPPRRASRARWYTVEHVLVDHVGREQAERRGHPRIARHEHHGVPTSSAICAANSGPAPPSATSAKSRGS